MARESLTLLPLWPDSTAVIVGGGPSVTVRQIRAITMAQLEGRCRVFAVNDAAYLLWNADWLHACDFKWWNWHIQRVQHFAGRKTTCDITVPDAWAGCIELVPPVKYTGYRGGWIDDPSLLCGGGNSGYQAVQIAAKVGATRILLVGFDMDGDHWFGDHPDGVGSAYPMMIENFATIVEPLRCRNIQVTNCSESSALDCFPTGDLENLL